MPFTQEEKRKRIKRAVIAGAAFLLVLCFALLTCFSSRYALLPAAAVPERAEGEFRIHFLGAGQGDCTMLEFPDGEVLVVDGGDGSFPINNRLVRYLKGLSPTGVSLLLTHADVDHFGSFCAMLKTFDVATVYLPLLPGESREYFSLLDGVEREGCEVKVLSRYDRLEKEGGYLVCLNPRGDEADEDDRNDSSVVLYINFGGVTALLCGDISAAREKLLLREYSLSEGIFDSGPCAVRLENIDFLKAPHHASAYSSSDEFLRLLRPKNFIVACGIGNDYKHPSGEALARFRAASPVGNIYRTDELGDVIVSVKGASYIVTTRGEL